MKRLLKILLFVALPAMLLAAGGLYLLGGEPGVDEGSWLVVQLEGDLPDRVEAGLLEMSGATPPSMLGLRRIARRAAADERIAGVLLQMGHGGVRAGRCEELSGLLDDLREAGKQVRVTAHSLDLASWILASHADEIILHPAGRLDLRSPAMMIPFFGGALKKFGVIPDIIRHGEHKAIYEQFAHEEPSPELAADLSDLHTSTWEHIRSISGREGKGVAEIERLASAGSISAQQALDRGWVDALEEGSEVLATLEDDPAQPVIDRKTYALVSDLSAGLAAHPAIAVLSLEGTIMAGDSGELPLIGRTQGINALRRGIDEINGTPHLKGVIVRIESPGGDAFTSEEIWRELGRLREELPVVALMGSQATSGGYYAAVACKWIYCLPSTLTGSIGIVGMRFLPGGTLEMLGVQTHVVSEEGISGPSPWGPHTEESRKVALRELEDSYDLFVERVRTGRGFDQGTALAVATGQAFRGPVAREKGLVDGLGGWDDAWQKICELAEVGDAGTASLEVFPRPTSWWDRILSSPPAAAVTTLDALPALIGKRKWYLGPLLRW